MQPKPSSRIKSLETRATTIEAAIEELSSDQAENDKALFAHVQKGFDQAHAFAQERFEIIDNRLDHIEGDITSIKDDVTSIKSTQEQILKLLQQK